MELVAMSSIKTYVSLPIPGVRLAPGDSLTLKATIVGQGEVRVDELSIVHLVADPDDYDSESCDLNWTPDP
jgi:hypothetical protein